MNKSTSTTTTGSTDCPATLLTNCFRAIIAARPAWKNSVMGDPAQWARDYRSQLLAAMVEQGINSTEMIERGMTKLRATDKPWLPAPGEFCQWCKVDRVDYGLPSIDAAFQNARLQCGKPGDYRTWAHEAVYLAAVEVGFFDLKTVQDGSGNFRDVKNRFGQAYGRLCSRVISGEKLAMPEAQRIAKKSTDWNSPRNKIAREKTIETLKNLF